MELSKNDVWCPGGCCTDLNELCNDDLIVREDGSVICRDCADEDDGCDFGPMDTVGDIAPMTRAQREDSDQWAREKGFES